MWHYRDQITIPDRAMKYVISKLSSEQKERLLPKKLSPEYHEAVNVSPATQAKEQASKEVKGSARSYVADGVQWWSEQNASHGQHR
jgi:hypothetical protein